MTEYLYQEWHLILGKKNKIEWENEFVPLGIRERQDGTIVICFLIPVDRLLTSEQKKSMT